MTPLPDAEAAIAAAIRADSEVASFVADRVYTRIPSDPVWPLVRLTRSGGGPVFQNPPWLDLARITVEAWGELADGTGRPSADGKQRAADLMAAIQAALHALDGGAVGDAIVTAVESEVGPTWTPDPDTDRPRYVLIVRAFVHPAA